MNSLELKDTPQTKYDNCSGSPSRRFRYRGIAIRLFVTCWMVFVLHFATNVVREIYPALSLGDHLSFNVSEYMGLHPDIFEVQGRGAFINNNPGASILGAIPYAMARPFIDLIVDRVQQIRAKSPAWHTREYETKHNNSRIFFRKARERGLDVKLGLAAGVIQAFCMAPISALSAVVMFYILINLKRSNRMALILALLYAFATPVFYRTAQLSHNLLVGHFAFFSFILLWRPWANPSLPPRSHYLLAGFLCGWTVVLDYSGVVVVFALSIYLLSRWVSLPKHSKTRFEILFFVLGVALSLAVLMGYQWSCFGNPFFPAQHYMPPANFTDQGYRGLDWPQWDLLWKTAFSMRYGLFTSAPLLLLAFYIPGWSRSNSRIVRGSELGFIVIYLTAFFIFCAANQYGRIQFNTGVRHIVPVIPFLFLLVASVFTKLPTLLAILIGIGTTYWSWCLAMYRDVEFSLGILESLIHITSEGFRLPWLTTLKNMGYVSSQYLPLLLILLIAGAILILWTVGKPLATEARHDKLLFGQADKPS